MDWLVWQIVDSAFPTGVFAHSWGLEAAWQQGEVPDGDALRRLLDAALQQTAYGALPLLTAAYRNPEHYAGLDARADAFLTNAVANRASRVQGRTLAATAKRVWPSESMERVHGRASAGCAHVAPLSGLVFRTVGVPLDTARTALLFGTARGLLAAAVRLGIIGGYEAQRLQHAAGAGIETLLARSGGMDAEAICQTAPILDLLQAAHDRLYSRLFQS